MDVGFIHPIDYPEWVSNILPIGKSSIEIQICIDFKNLNKACPKGDLPLPNININVDLSIGHEIISLIDGLSGYNQIKISLEDQHKIDFITPEGTFFL